LDLSLDLFGVTHFQSTFLYHKTRAVEWKSFRGPASEAQSSVCEKRRRVNNLPDRPRISRAARMHSRVALLVLVGLCLEARAFVPQLALRPTGANRCSAACRAPLRVSMQFQRTGSQSKRELEFKMPKSAPITSRREPEGPLEDDPSLPIIEDIIKALDARKVCPPTVGAGETAPEILS
jgi:hypothetical protein